MLFFEGKYGNKVIYNFRYFLEHSVIVSNRNILDFVSEESSSYET